VGVLTLGLKSRDAVVEGGNDVVLRVAFLPELAVFLGERDDVGLGQVVVLQVEGELVILAFKVTQRPNNISVDRSDFLRIVLHILHLLILSFQMLDLMHVLLNRLCIMLAAVHQNMLIHDVLVIGVLEAVEFGGLMADLVLEALDNVAVGGGGGLLL